MSQLYLINRELVGVSLIKKKSCSIFKKMPAFIAVDLLGKMLIILYSHRFANGNI